MGWMPPAAWWRMGARFALPCGYAGFQDRCLKQLLQQAGPDQGRFQNIRRLAIESVQEVATCVHSAAVL